MKYYLTTLFFGAVIAIASLFVKPDAGKTENPLVIMNPEIVEKELEKAILFKEVRSLTTTNTIGIDKKKHLNK